MNKRKQEERMEAMMTEVAGDKEGKIMQAIQWAMDINPQDCISLVNAKRKAFPSNSDYKLAKRMISTYARKGAATGFLSSFASNPLIAAPSAVVDVGFMLRFYAGLTGAIGYLANPKYFDDPDWKSDAFLALAGPKAVSRIMQRVGVEGTKQGSKVLIRKYLSKEVLRAVKKFILKWFGKKVTQRAIIAKSIPLIGGVIGAAWNYFEIRIVSKRILKQHFG